MGRRFCEQVSSLNIVHVFGQVAKLAWQDGGGVEYRRDIKGINVAAAAKNLRIIYEEENKNPDLGKAKRLINEAYRVFFLGFGYAKKNLGVLGIPGVFGAQQRIYGTALSLTDREIEDVTVAFKITIGGHLHFEKSDCRALLRKYL